MLPITSISCLTEVYDPIILDASVVVNLNATGYADRILKAIPMGVLIPVPVVKELNRGTALGYNDATDLYELLEQNCADLMKVPIDAQQEYIALVAGSSVSSLGDGEAATIACALASGAWAAIDERKARRICLDRYEDIKIASTVDILAHPKVIAELGVLELSKALLAALEIANMQVHEEHMDWVISQLDSCKLKNCLSLPRSIRQAYQG